MSDSVFERVRGKEIESNDNGDKHKIKPGEFENENKALIESEMNGV
jgi:hypothetical protein